MRSRGSWQPIVALTVLMVVHLDLRLSCAQVAQPGAERVPAASASESAAAVAANSAFAIDVYRLLCAETPHDNLFLSPLPLSMALTMVAEGAQGETAEQMRRVLHLPSGSLATVCRGHAALRTALIPPDTPRVVSDRIAKLRRDLLAVEEAIVSESKQKKYREARAAAEDGHRIADELNALSCRTRPYELRIANAIWLDRSFPIAAGYADAMRTAAVAVIQPMDFRQAPEMSRRTINDWVAGETNDRVRDFLAKGAIDALTRLVVTNAVYFNGEWEQPFDKQGTRDKAFRAAGGSVKIPMMNGNLSGNVSYTAVNGDGSLFATPREVAADTEDDDPFLYPDRQGFTAVSLPYRGGRLAMTILLPRTPDGLPGLESRVTAGKLRDWLANMEKRPVQVTVPKVTLEFESRLVPILESLGMQNAFQRDRAEFGGLTESIKPGNRLFISDVIQKTFVAISEVGTESAAVTAVVLGTPEAAVRKPPVPEMRRFDPVFRADHPFFFLIHDRTTGCVLFMGSFRNPQT